MSPLCQEINLVLEKWQQYLLLAMDIAEKLVDCDIDDFSIHLDHRHRIMYKTEECKKEYLSLWESWSRQSNVDQGERAVLVEKRKIISEMGPKIHFQTEKILYVMNVRLSRIKLEMASHHKTQKAIKSYVSVGSKSAMVIG